MCSKQRIYCFAFKRFSARRQRVFWCIQLNFDWFSIVLLLRECHAIFTSFVYIVVSLILIFSIIRTLDYPDFLLRSRRVRIIEVRLYLETMTVFFSLSNSKWKGKSLLGQKQDYTFHIISRLSWHHPFFKGKINNEIFIGHQKTSCHQVTWDQSTLRLTYLWHKCRNFNGGCQNFCTYVRGKTLWT